MKQVYAWMAVCLAWIMHVIGKDFVFAFEDNSQTCRPQAWHISSKSPSCISSWAIPSYKIMVSIAGSHRHTQLRCTSPNQLCEMQPRFRWVDGHARVEIVVWNLIVPFCHNLTAEDTRCLPWIATNGLWRGGENKAKVFSKIFAV